jgi:hypothetical protein
VLRTELAFQFGADALDFERLLLARDLCGGLQFIDSRTKCSYLVPVALLDLGGSLGQFTFETNPCVLAKSFTPSRSRSSARFNLPSPRHSGHSMASVGGDPLTYPPRECASENETGGRWWWCYFLRPIRRPGSGELMETKFPCPSRVVWNRSLVRPVIWFFSSRTTADVSLWPLVT